MNRRDWSRIMSLALAVAVAMIAVGTESSRGEDHPCAALPVRAAVGRREPGRRQCLGLARPARGRDGPGRGEGRPLLRRAKRLRLLGVNLCFGANFPRHDDAANVAARLAKFGVNAVRFHHMDMQTVPGGIFRADGRTLDPESARPARLPDRPAQGARHLRRPEPPRQPILSGDGQMGGDAYFHKGVDQFVPEMIEWQRGLRADLLRHVNPVYEHRHMPRSRRWRWSRSITRMRCCRIGGAAGSTTCPRRMPASSSGNGTSGWRRSIPTSQRSRRAWGVREAALGGEMLGERRFFGGLRRLEPRAARHGPGQGADDSRGSRGRRRTDAR